MILKKSHLLLIALLGAAIASCQKEPSLSSLHEDYLVYTAYDEKVDFDQIATFFLPDSILLIGNTAKSEYWKDQSAQQLIAAVAQNMQSDGFVRVDERETAEAGLQLSYVERVTYYVGWDNPYWWWYYPYYWGPGYWGNWSGWYYPFPVYYGYTAGSLLIEMVGLDPAETPETAQRKLPVLWNAFIGGLLTDSQALNLQRTIAAIDQAFGQSPYLER